MNKTTNRLLYALAAALPVAALVVVALVNFHPASGADAAAVCTPTGFMRDNINLTAALVNPAKTVRSRVNATGCNIGVYYGPGSSGTVNSAEIFGANYYGVVNNGGNVTVTHARIHDIGESPFNGDQHGVGIYFAYGSGATGKINGNTIWNYQKGGIVVNGTGDSASITNNVVVGLGPIGFIAQNGIQVGYGASVSAIKGNIVADNSYTGSSTVDGGIIIVGGPCYGAGDAYTVNSAISGNISINNDIGIWLTNLDANCNPDSTATNIAVAKNVVTDDGVTNGYVYQAGVADQGDGDSITGNSICGVGYTATATYPNLYTIDVTATNNPTVSGNLTCGSSSAISSHAQARHLPIARAISLVH
jgi:hypothetical protein